MTEIKQAKHTHTLFDGRETALDIRNINDPNLHWHEVAGDKTSTDAYGESHTHEFQGDKTSTPINTEEVNMESNSDHEDDEDKRRSKAKIETKYCGGYSVEVKEEAVNGVPIGIVKGYIATWGLDRGNDRFTRGAFKDSLIELRAKNRQIRFKDHHFRTVGGFPIDRVFEDDKGLFGVGHINLDVQQGREIFSLAKQGVISDFSVGFSVDEFEMDGPIRNIHKATIWEGSLVDEPMNTEANVTEVKAVVPFQDHKMAARNQTWGAEAAIARIRELTGSDESPSAEYKKAFVWFDATESNLFSAYKLPIADVINGKMVAVPKAVFSAAAALQGARGGVDLPEIDRPKAIRHLERYYAKMDVDSPFTDKQYFVSDDVKEWTARDLEKFLKASGSMSKSASKIIASRIFNNKSDIDTVEKVDYKAVSKVLAPPTTSWNDVLNELGSIS